MYPPASVPTAVLELPVELADKELYPTDVLKLPVFDCDDLHPIAVF